ncbi:MAG: DNA polymerase III subunit beta [Ignavibacteria bacterium]|jgi:DNA polymerase-3 subunit beta|nr:DNA polymerase III subunit beta [Ignavibacteria bacterium]MBK6877665.1 DNA polymerase III subunit beta [Ignavibacteria bacterium]MBK9227398.1 DNA polymerase III subunit beta [Ignavibacteria bacterium]
MKFTVKGDKLSECLANLNSIVPSRSTLPLLGSIFFELKGDELVLMASDLEIFIRTKLKVNGKTDGQAAIPAKKLFDVSRTLPADELSMDINEKNRLTIKTKKGKYTMSGEPGDEFPQPEVGDDMKQLVFKGSGFKRCLSKVVHAANTEELKRNMMGILMEVGSSEVKFVATDSYRLSRISRTDITVEGTSDEKIVIPLKTAHLLVRLGVEDTTIMDFNERDLKITFGDYEIFSKLMGETFPNYENVIPTNNDKLLKVSKHDFNESMNRALILANPNTKRVILEIAAESMTIKTDNPEVGSEGEETLDCSFTSRTGTDEIEGNKFVIAFNGEFISQALSQIETEIVDISFGSPSKAAIAQPDKQADMEVFTELIMPVRVG